MGEKFSSYVCTEKYLKGKKEEVREGGREGKVSMRNNTRLLLPQKGGREGRRKTLLT
jgi:hypothetical protein